MILFFSTKIVWAEISRPNMITACQFEISMHLVYSRKTLPVFSCNCSVFLKGKDLSFHFESWQTRMLSVFHALRSLGNTSALLKRIENKVHWNSSLYACPISDQEVIHVTQHDLELAKSILCYSLNTSTSQGVRGWPADSIIIGPR